MLKDTSLETAGRVGQFGDGSQPKLPENTERSSNRNEAAVQDLRRPPCQV